MGSSQISSLGSGVVLSLWRRELWSVYLALCGARQLKASLFLRVSGSLVLRERALSCTVSALDSAWRCFQMEKPCLEDVLWDIKALLFHCFSSSLNVTFLSWACPSPQCFGTRHRERPLSSHWGSIWDEKQNVNSALWPLLLSYSVYFLCNIYWKKNRTKQGNYGLVSIQFVKFLLRFLSS